MFDKDNTLTRPFSRSLDPDAAASLESCKEVFGQSIVLFSNSAGLKQYDPEGQYKTVRSRSFLNISQPGLEAEKLEQDLGISVLRHLEKKPAGGVHELVEFFGYV